MKMLDKIDIAIKMSEENLTQERNNLLYHLEHGKFKTSFQKEKVKKRLERINARINENAQAMKLMACENYDLFRNVYNNMQKIEKTIHNILSLVNEKIDKLNDENAFCILKIINTELQKRRKTKVFYLINYTWHLTSQDFYDGYKVKTKRFNDFILNLFENYPHIPNLKYNKCEDTDVLYLYAQDIRHYIEICPLSTLRLHSKEILIEYIKTHFQILEEDRDSVSYNDIINSYLGEVI